MEVRWMYLSLLASVAAGCQLNGPLDLGHPLSTQIHTDVSVPFRRGELREQEYYGAKFFHNDFCSGEHVSTHLDAPFHFFENGWTVDQIPLERLIANGAFLNLTAEVAGNHSFRLQPSHIDAWIERNGAFPNNSVLLISYGWAQRYHNHTLYAGTSSSNFGEFVFPGPSTEAVDRIAQIDEIIGFGIDTPAIDPSGSAYAHGTLARKNIYNLKQVNFNQPCLPEKGFKVVSMPMNIAGGTGAPTRVIAVPNCPA